MEACGVDLYLDQQALDTTTPAGKLMFQITGAFAEFERSMVRQRVNAGLKLAVEAGKQLGRPRMTRPWKSESRINCGPARACWQSPRNAGSAAAPCSVSRGRWQALALSTTPAPPPKDPLMRDE